MPAVSAWEDDPRSSAAARPVARPVPLLAHPRLGVVIAGQQPPPRCYATSSPAFRYWNAADALARTTRFWAGLVPPSTRWTCGADLTALIDAGRDLNAYYDRKRLCFFHAPVDGTTVYSGESPDVVCHEPGHAVLDALAPALWNAASIEAAAMHEAFGDISAMLSALQLASVRRAVIRETDGEFTRSSRLSRLAEQLGWAIRQSHPDAVEADCLRNAANSFFYAEPESLPPMAPAVVLSSEPHSFSRVFSATWLDVLAAMAAVNGADSDRLAVVSRDAGALIARAVRFAKATPNYFAQVAAEVLRADAFLFEGRYRAVLQRAFVGRGVLSSASALAVLVRGRRRDRAGGAVAGPSTERRRLWIDGATYGIRVTHLVVDAPVSARARGARAAATDLGPLAPTTAERAARAFVEDLLRRDRIDPGQLTLAGAASRRPSRATHALERHGREVFLVRTRFH